MATTFTVNVGISNPNKVIAKALITHLSDSSVDKSETIEAGKNATVAVQTTEYKGTINVLFSANGFNNSESQTINYEFNPLDKVTLTCDYTVDLNKGTITVTPIFQNDSNYNLVLKKTNTSAWVTFAGMATTGFAWASSDKTEVEFNRTEAITPFSPLVLTYDNTAAAPDFESIVTYLNVDWVLDGVTKSSNKEIKG